MLIILSLKAYNTMHKVMLFCINSLVMIIFIKSSHFLLYRFNEYFNNLGTSLESVTNVHTNKTVEVRKQINAALI